VGRLPRPLAISLALGFLSAPAPSAHQQLPPQTALARDLQEAERLQREHKLDEAIAAFRAIIETAHAAGLPAEEAQAQCGLGQSLVTRGRYADAPAPLQQCLDMAERFHNDVGVARATLGLSQAADLMGRRADAAAFATRAVVAADATGDPRRRAFARLQLLHLGGSSLEEERDITDRVIADARIVNDPVLEAAALHSLGDRFFNTSRYEEAFDLLTRARDLYHGAAAFGAEGTTLNSLGRVYRAHGRLDEALKCQLEALALHEKYGTSLELMQSHNAVAVVEGFLGNTADARRHYERALAIARLSGSPRIQDFLNANIAFLLTQEGQHEKAARSLEEVIAHGVDSYTSMRYGNLVSIYLKLNRPQDALSAGEHALATCGDGPTECLEALDNRAAAYAAVGNYVAARADIQNALDRIEALRAKLVPSDFLKQNFHEALRDIYSRSIALAFSQHDDRQSLETAELSSSRAFLDLLAVRQTPAAERALIPDMSVRGAPATDSRDLASHATAAPATANDLVAIASRLNSTVLVYWPADDGLFMWVVKRDGRIASRKVDISTARLVQLIRATVPPAQEPRAHETSAAHSVTTRGTEYVSADESTSDRPWRQLYETLIAPIRTELPRTPGTLLTIVPHGVLMNVSFAALKNRDGRYLLEDYAIHYAPAGAVLGFTAGMRRSGARGGSALLVADPTTVRRSPLDPQLPPLPGARLEVAQIAGLMPHSRVTVLEGGDATEPRVTSAASAKTIVHFATHAIVRDDAPNDSYLAFGPGGGSTTGVLTSRDVYNLRLDADLVVLSACRSGGGRVTGDGIATFARAFIYAGTPSLVVSLWDVADEPTGRLLPSFYRSWLAGASKARSLRRAQLQLLADLRAGSVRVETKAGPIVLPEHPVFWAGFVLIGEPE